MAGAQGQSELASLEDKIRDLLEEQHEQELPTWDLPDLDRALGAFSTRAGRGSDTVGPEDVARLPGIAKVEFLVILEESEKLGTWPWQLLFAITR